MEKKVPVRMCIVCKEGKPKKELLRIVATEDGLTLDKTGKLNGRGAYICDNDDCMNRCLKTKALHKAFKKNIAVEEYEKIKEQYFGQK